MNGRSAQGISHCLVLGLILFLHAASFAEDAAFPREVRLQSPLTTVYALDSWPQPAPAWLLVDLEVPSDAPADLGIGAWVSNYEGRWYQRLHPQPLSPGRHRLRFDLRQGLQAEGHAAGWDPLAMSLSRRAGLLWWSQQESQASLRILSIKLGEEPPEQGAVADYEPHLYDLTLSPFLDGQWQGQTGERSLIRFRSAPAVPNPYDPQAFRSQLVFMHQESGRLYHISAFWKIPMDLADAGDREAAKPSAPGFYEARFRPQLPGTYTVQLRCWWNKDEDAAPCLEADLPDLLVSGEAWDDFVRIDSEDPRFFSVDGDFFWPIGLNIRSVNDIRGARRTGSRLTPDRGTLAYHDYLRRFAASGGNAIEIWLSSWNLALEWREDWPEFVGLGFYSQERAARLDSILDKAYALGVRINLVVRNHGQASERTDREWHNSPFNTANGGIIDSAQEFFHDPQALAYQERLHRYLIARYADHPAILGWKLFSEVNLTAGRRDDVRTWHEHTAARFHALDPYQHPVTTHWSGDYRQPDRVIVAQEGICYVCIDAYHGRREGQTGRWISDILWLSTQAPGERGLHYFNKPVLVTEYGGSASAAPQPQLIAEHQIGPWVALVAGHGGSPMLWWFEWVDQNNFWRPYQAIASFIYGEDLRSPQAEAQLLNIVQGEDVWGAAWFRPGRVLGYLLDRKWGYDGSLGDPQSTSVELLLPSGNLTIEWWNADTGERLARYPVRHQGGRLLLKSPPFLRHLAFKVLQEP